MDENRFEFQGKQYKAKRAVGCPGCVFACEKQGCTADIDAVPSCASGAREDGVQVIFVEVKGE
jgi:hypothetical protein